MSLIPNRMLMAQRFDTRNTAITIIMGELCFYAILVGFLTFGGMSIADKGEFYMEACFVIASLFLLLAIPSVLAYVGIHKNSARLLVPHMIGIFIWTIFMLVVSVAVFVWFVITKPQNISNWHCAVIFMLGLGVNLVIFLIQFIVFNVFYNTYLLLKEQESVMEEPDIEIIPLIENSSQ